MVKRFILWDFPRATWQYDVMVGIILAFIFLTPRAWFRDQPRIANANGIVTLSSENGRFEYFAPPEILANVPDDQQTAKVKSMLHMNVTRLQPVLNSEGELQGYFIFARR